MSAKMQLFNFIILCNFDSSTATFVKMEANHFNISLIENSSTFKVF